MNSKELSKEVQATLYLYKNENLKKLAWKLDREVWALVEKGEATTSWGRRETMKAINNYASHEVSRVIGELVDIMTKYRDGLWSETEAGFAMSGNAVNHCIHKAQSLLKQEGEDPHKKTG